MPRRVSLWVSTLLSCAEAPLDLTAGESPPAVVQAAEMKSIEGVPPSEVAPQTLSAGADLDASLLWARAVEFGRADRNAAWSVQPVPEWVQPISASPKRRGAAVVLYEQQINFAGTRQRFEHHIYHVRSAEDVRLFRAVRFKFYPPHERFWLHRVEIHRGGRVLPQSSPFQFEFQPETVKITAQSAGPPWREAAGAPALVVGLNDLRVGDIVDIKFTVDGFGDPRLDHRSSAFLMVRPTRLPADLVRYRVLSDPGEPPLVIRNVHTGLKPRVRRLGERTEYVWTIKDASVGQEGHEVERLPHIEVSNWSWSDIAESTRLMFTRDETPPELAAVAARISAEHHEPHERAFAALRYVQHEIAFSTADLGEWTSQPRPLSRIVRERTADCKGKAVMLMTLLRELEIPDSHVVLVDKSGADLRELLPSPGHTQHVIVAADIAGREVFMDPTRQGGAGDLWTMRRLQFRSGLSTAPGRGLVQIPHVCDDETAASGTTLHYRLGAPGQPTRLRIERLEMREGAEDLRKGYRETTPAEIVAQLTSRLTGFYPRGATVMPQTFADDPNRNEVRITGDVEILDPWQTDTRGPLHEFHSLFFETTVQAILRDATNPNFRNIGGGAVRVEVIVDLPFVPTLEGESFTVKQPGLELRHHVAASQTRVTARSEFRACFREIEDSSAIQAALARLRFRVRP